MANKREFKKYVTAVSTGLVNDMMTAYYCVKEADKEKIDNAIVKILAAGEKAIMKTNVKFDRTLKAFEDKKNYKTEKAKFFTTVYDKANKEFGAEIKEAVKIYNEAFPAEVKKELKEVASK